MNDFSSASIADTTNLPFKKEDDPDVLEYSIIMEPDQTDLLKGYVVFAWKTRNGYLRQSFGPFYFGLAAELFAQERWPNAYKAWDEKRMASAAEVS